MKFNSKGVSYDFSTIFKAEGMLQLMELGCAGARQPQLCERRKYGREHVWIIGEDIASPWKSVTETREGAANQG